MNWGFSHIAFSFGIQRENHDLYCENVAFISLGTLAFHSCWTRVICGLSIWASGHAGSVFNSFRQAEQRPGVSCLTNVFIPTSFPATKSGWSAGDPGRAHVSGLPVCAEVRPRRPLSTGRGREGLFYTAQEGITVQVFSSK